MEFFTKYVSRGAAWLDQEKPGWDRQIDLKKLDISSSNCCVIGQLFGDFNKCHDSGRLSTYPLLFARRRGFDCNHRSDKNFRKLTQAWRSEIERRMAV